MGTVKHSVCVLFCMKRYRQKKWTICLGYGIYQNGIYRQRFMPVFKMYKELWKVKVPKTTILDGISDRVFFFNYFLHIKSVQWAFCEWSEKMFPIVLWSRRNPVQIVILQTNDIIKYLVTAFFQFANLKFN